MFFKFISQKKSSTKLSDYIISSFRSSIFALSIFTSSIICFGLTGCGKKEVVFTTENQTETYEEKSTESSFSDIETSWVDEIAIVNTNQTAKINASVSVPEFTNLCVSSASVCNFTDTYKETFLKGITDSPIYYFDDAHLPKNVLASYITDIKENIAEYQSDIYAPDVAGPLIEEENQKLTYYENLYQNAPDDYVEVSAFTSNEYLITLNDIYYYFTFIDDTRTTIKMTPLNEISHSTEGVSFLDVLAVNKINKPKSIYHTESYSQYPSSTQLCPLSYDDIVKAANDFLYSAGLYDFHLVSASNLSWITDDNTFDCGCFLTYYRYIDTIPVDGYRYVDEADKKEEICIAITDAGIIDFCYDNPLEITDSVNDVKILSYETIKEAFQNAIGDTDYYKEFNLNINFNNLSFMYYPVCSTDNINDDNNNNYNNNNDIKLIPVWILSHEIPMTPFSCNIDYAVIINAIDGSVVNMQ